MRKYTTMPNFSLWTISELVSYCKRWDNDNGEWENVTESEREYLVSVATETFNELQY